MPTFRSFPNQIYSVHQENTWNGNKRKAAKNINQDNWLLFFFLFILVPHEKGDRAKVMSQLLVKKIQDIQFYRTEGSPSAR